MPVPESPDPTRATVLQAGYRAVPLSEADAGAPLRLCVVVPEKPSAASGPFLLLRDTSDASIYLGCVTDAGGQVRQWLEVWVQSAAGLSTLPETTRDTFSNRTLDARWIRRAATLRGLDPAAMLTTGWETLPPPPLFFDAALRTPVHPAEAETGARWAVCREDARLTASGLPAYNSSLHRYLFIKGAEGQPPRFSPATPGAPESDATRPLAAIAPGLVPFNPAAGLMLFRAFDPLGCEEWIDLLSGVAWKGVEHAGKACRLGGVYRTLQDAPAIRQGGGHLFLGRQGKAGRLLEAYHLKVSFLAEAFRLVRGAVKAEQLPLLNLSAESFRVRLADADTALPFLYTARTSIAVPGEAFALPVETTESRYFLPARLGEASIYRPAASALPVSGRATVRLRKVAQADAGAVCEGTLATQQKLSAAGSSDLLKFSLHLATGRLELFGRFESTSERLAAGEARFRTLPQRLAPDVAAALQAAEGVSFSDTTFETVPVLSTPCDLYSLGVLAVRALLVDDTQSLPVALDEVLSLAVKAAASHNPEAPLPACIAGLVEGDSHWRYAFSPQRLVRDELGDKEGWALFPPALWWSTLSAIVRLFPGMGPDSHCRDFGDAPPLALDEVFTTPLAELDDLVLRSRSLIVSDSQSNREIRTVISGYLERLSA